MRLVGWLVVVVVLGVAWFGCRATCVNGETESCTCTDGRMGAQVCRSDGAFDPCVCTGAIGGGTGGGVPTAGGGGGQPFPFGGGTGGSPFGGGAGGGGGAPPKLPYLATPAAAHVVVDDPLVLSVAHDAGNLPIEWSWQVQSPDGGAAMVDDPARAQPLLTPTVAGNYVARVTATTDAGSTTVSFAVRASPGRLLGFEPTAYATHRESDQLALGVASPFAVELHHLRTGASTRVTLARSPRALAFTPDGSHLVVGEDGQLEVVSLQVMPPEVVATWPIVGLPMKLSASNSHAYLQYATDVLASVRLSTGERAERTNGVTLGGLRLHPDGVRVYAMEGESFGDVYRFDIADGGLSQSQRKFFSNAPRNCADGWLTRDGTAFITGCGWVLRTDPVFVNDLVQGGQLPSQQYLGLEESADGGLYFGLVQTPIAGTSPQRLGPPMVLIAERATLRQNSIAPQPDTTGLLGGQLRARFIAIDTSDRVHVFLMSGAGVPTAKTFWLIRTVGEL